MFAQALKNIFQNSVESIQELKTSNQHRKIEVNILIQDPEGLF